MLLQGALTTCTQPPGTPQQSLLGSAFAQAEGAAAGTRAWDLKAWKRQE